MTKKTIYSIIGFVLFILIVSIIGLLTKNEDDFHLTSYPSKNGLKNTISIKNGKVTGWAYKFYENDKLAAKYYHINNKINGIGEEYYDTGEIFTRSFWRDSVRNGYFLKFYKNGKIKESGYYKNGNPIGEWKIYNYDGTLAVKGEKIFYKEYYKNGETKIEVELINGLQNGTLLEYYQNAIIKTKEDWFVGIPIGNYMVFDKNGHLIYHHIQNSIINGEFGNVGRWNIYEDSTKIIDRPYRIVIPDTNKFKNSIQILPTKNFKFGIENYYSIYTPNVPTEILNWSAENAILRYNPINKQFLVLPKLKNKKVILRFKAMIKNIIVEYNPIELIAIN